MKAPFNIRIQESEGLKLVNTYESYINVPENNGERGKRYQSKNIKKSILESLRRTKNTIRDYAFGTHWDYFITLTLDPKKINRYSRDELLHEMNKLLTTHRRQAPDFKYLLITENHKDGAIHLHGLIKNAKNIKKTRLTNKYNRPIYNWTAWSSKLGHTRLDPIPENHNERFATYLYITKYITLDLIIEKMYDKTNKKRYFASKGLPKPTTKYQLVPEVMTTTADYLISTKMLSYRTYDVKTYVDKELKAVNVKHQIALES